MCFSARVQQNLKQLSRRFGAEIDWAMFEEVFRRRLETDDIKLSRSLEDNFDQPSTDIERRSKDCIDAFRQRRATQWEADTFKQKKRLADAQRSLKEKETNRAREDERIATKKIGEYLDRLNALRRVERDEEEDWYALTAFMGADLMQASVTGFSPLAFVARKLGARAVAAFG